MEEDNADTKPTGILQIAKLKELLQKWQPVALFPTEDGANPMSDPMTAHGAGGIPPAVNKRLTSVAHCDSDEESCHSLELPPDVPKGYLAVYVGPQLRRFVIPTSYLSHPLFKVLLDKVEEEFGFDHRGGLTIPCEIETFKYLLKCMEQHA